MAKRLTEERIEKMAVEIRAFLLEHGIWQDTDIYFNGKRFTTETRRRRNIITTTRRSCSLRITRIREIILSMWQTTTF